MRIERMLLTTGLLLAVSGCVDYGAEGYVATPGYGAPAYGAPGYGGVRSVDDFYAPLSQYGRWVQTRWGQGWQPAVAPDWRPYTLGRWINDPGFGWTWASDEPWGWATYHYGRWGFDPALGWVWIPDTEWGPGWVAWRDGDDVTGWAPLPPQVSISFGYDWNSWGYDRWYAPSWIWVPRQQFGHSGRYNYLPMDHGRDYWARSRDATRYDRDGDRVVNRGPGRGDNPGHGYNPGQFQNPGHFENQRPGQGGTYQPNQRPVPPVYGGTGGGGYRPDNGRPPEPERHNPGGYGQTPAYGSAPTGGGGYRPDSARPPEQGRPQASQQGWTPPVNNGAPPTRPHLQEAPPHWDNVRPTPSGDGGGNVRPSYHAAPQQSFVPPPVATAPAPPSHSYAPPPPAYTPPPAHEERAHESRQQRDPGDHKPDPQ